jgi:hypothetical protein
MTSAGLCTAMRTHAQGLYCLEAAAELLIGHSTWLDRSDFTTCFVIIGRGPRDDELAVADWQAAITALDSGQLPCSGSEGRMLRIAASLADGIPVDLREVLTGLDTRNAALVSQAVRHATGHRPENTHRHHP